MEFVFFVKASYRDIEDYDINLIILKEGETVTCYEGSITSELRAVMGKNLKKDSDVIREYIDIVFKSKCDQGESFVYSLKDSTFIWKKVLGNRKVKLLIAKIPLNKRDILSEQNKFFSQGIDSLNHLQKSPLVSLNWFK
ncbi:unnamed protein product [Lepeophtheirus salmonis]|uniref:(salmon louse) hypothetical protein n=1 Tax=Lepeophtheirus salmonis TaxID=72036 RepID=A0A7R8CWD3_LEPSM|nr:unnamed protein product [Lepeophtheirus salmonis]CAF2950760.1 unnamed protein product [Lepeophtheirus salmonis]